MEEELEAIVIRCVDRFMETPLEKEVLDLEGVDGKMRQKVLNHKLFRDAVSRERAKEAIDEMQVLKIAKKRFKDLIQGYGNRKPIRGEKDNGKSNKEFLEITTQYMKLNDMMNKLDEKRVIEGSLINFLFVPISKEEFEENTKVEVNEGDEFDEGLFDVLVNEGSVGIKETKDEVKKEEVIPYYMHDDGTIEGY